jgi:hypothetical protein
MKVFTVITVLFAFAIALAASASGATAQSAPPATPQAADDPAGDAGLIWSREFFYRGSSDPAGPDVSETNGAGNPVPGGAVPGDSVPGGSPSGDPAGAPGGDAPSGPGTRGDSSPEGDPEKLPLPHK